MYAFGKAALIELNYLDRQKYQKDFEMYSTLIKSPTDLGFAETNVQSNPFLLPANINLAISFSENLKNGDLTVNVGNSNISVPASDAGSLFFLGWREKDKSLRITPNSTCPGGTVSVYAYDEWNRKYKIASLQVGPWSYSNNLMADNTLPTLTLQFDKNQYALNKLPTQLLVADNNSPITRGSTATYNGTDGLVKTAAINEKRYQDGISLIELTATNLALNSEDFSNASWVKTGITITGDSSPSPNGLITADKFVATSDNSAHEAFFSNSQTIGNTITASVYAKYGELEWVSIKTSGEGLYAFFNVAKGVIGKTSVGITPSIQHIGYGWYRCSITRVVSGLYTGISFSVHETDTTANWSGNGLYGSYFWGAQLEAGAVTTSYIPTFSTSTTRSADLSVALASFSRSSTATYVGNNGLIQTAPINSIRLDYTSNPIVSQGVLLEDSRTNLVRYSEQFDQATWTKSRATIVPNTTTAPNGSIVADKLVEDTSLTNEHYVFSGIAVTSGTSYTYSIFVKAAERTNCVIRFFTTNGAFPLGSAFFNLTTGVVTSQLGTISNVSIVPYANGWYRIMATSTALASVVGNITIGLVQTGTTNIYTGDGVSGLHIWGAQIEAAPFASSYIPTTTAATIRDADVLIINPISSFYNQTNGTVYANYKKINGTTVSQNVVSFDDTTTLNYFRFINDATVPSQQKFDVVVGNSSVVSNIVSSSSTNGIRYKDISTYKLNDFSSCENAGSIVSDTTGAVPTVTRLVLGHGPNGNRLGGTISELRYYNFRVSNSELQRVTT